MAERMQNRLSLRRYLLLGILIPVICFVLIDSFILYRQTLSGINTAYDRTLLASAKSIGEQLDVAGEGALAKLTVRVPYAALEAFEADNRSRMFYRVTGFSGELVSGFDDIPDWRGKIADKPPYAALVDFYDDNVRGQAVRVAVLLQPVAGMQGQGVAVIQVAETLELRESLTREIMLATLWRQMVLALVIAGVVVWVVERAVQPVRRISAEIAARAEGDLAAIDTSQAPRELLPLLRANNQLMERLVQVLAHQKRFVRDAAHQLRTPLAVLKVQNQSALRGDMPAQQAMQEMALTLSRATALTNQMLSLAKVQQLRHQKEAEMSAWDTIVRELALEFAPLIADKNIDFGVETTPLAIKAHDWMLRELTRNLLHNAIKHTPEGGILNVRLRTQGQAGVLCVADSGPGIGQELRSRLFQPFSKAAAATGAANDDSGTGLGLAICYDITQALGGCIALDNRIDNARVVGMDAIVSFPL